MNFGAWLGAEGKAGWVWIAVLALVAAPFPFASMPLPERGLPILWLMLAGGLCLLARVATVSWPLALLLAWAAARVLWMGLEIDGLSLRANVVVIEAGRARPIQLLVLLAFVGVLFVVAQRLPGALARLAAWALVAGVMYEGVFGYLNLWGVYPWMTFIQAEHAGRPMGFLTHPNFWGSYMAVGLPVVWALLGVLPVVAILAMIAASWSGGPVISAAAGVILLAWPDLTRRARTALVFGAGAAIGVVMTVHEWRLSGRWENWSAAWPELMRYPIIGQGLGSWRVWADQYNQKLSAQLGRPEVFATLQAHSEPYQLWFELGLIGLFLAALWLLQVGGAAWCTWEAGAPPARADALLRGSRPQWWQPGYVPLERAWVAVLVVGAVNSLGSPVLHLPGQAAMLLFAVARCQAVASRISASLEDSPYRLPAPRRNGFAARLGQHLTPRTGRRCSVVEPERSEYVATRRTR